MAKDSGRMLSREWLIIQAAPPIGPIKCFLIAFRDICKQARQPQEARRPGAASLDDAQEINYPPTMRALVEIGYKGYVRQEFIPTRDPLQGLQQAVEVCDV